MVQSELDSDKGNFARITGGNSGRVGSVFGREPSFSRWCDADEEVHFNRELGNARSDLVDEDPGFELLFHQELQRGPLERERLFHLKFQHSILYGASNMDEDSIHRRVNGSEKHVPFDIENRPTGGLTHVDSSMSLEDHGSLAKSSRNPISVGYILKTIFFILIWYTFSLCLTLYNKTLLGADMGKFPAPYMMNTFHFIMQGVLSKIITWCWSHKFQTGVVMSWRDYFLKVVPTALGTALDVNLSNASLISISVTFATMCKSGAPIFLLLFAFAFRCKRDRISVMGVYTCYACCCYVRVPLVYDPDPFAETYGLKDPLTLMSYVAPVMAVATALLSLALDPWHELHNNKYFDDSRHITQSFFLMILGGILAFFMVLTEYFLVSVTSAVTVTIAGVVKEAVTILVAVLYFHDKFTWVKGLGLCTILFGVSLFNWYKYLKLQKGHFGEGEVAVLHTTDSAGKYVILEEMDEQDI
nr:probable sugar phosphate/phosphate translocator At1g06470 isoform X2 [Arachis hypogaea]